MRGGRKKKRQTGQRNTHQELLLEGFTGLHNPLQTLKLESLQEFLLEFLAGFVNGEIWKLVWLEFARLSLSTRDRRIQVTKAPTDIIKPLAVRNGKRSASIERRRGRMRGICRT